MTREELVGKMCEVFDPLSRDMAGRNPYKQAMAAALDVAIGELLPDPATMDYGKELDAVEHSWEWDHQSLRCAITQNKARQMVRDAVCIWWTNRRSRYLPKSDPAVEAVKEIVDEVNRRGGLRYDDYAERIVAAVRAADKEAHARQ